MMGGEIWIDSELGKGATFAFTIQVKRADKNAFLENDTAKRAVSGIRDARILVVDDDQDTLDIFMKVTCEAGASCDTVLTGKDALKLAAAACASPDEAYDIYFIDWNLPDIDGLKLANAIREEIPNTGDAAIVMLSAATWNLIDNNTEKAHINKFMNKPLFSFNIIDAINDCLGVGGHTEEAGPKSTEKFSGKHILLVDDVDINCEIVQTLLEPTEVDVTCAQNGKEAVKMFSEEPYKYDMIFMDLQMPEMDGYEATKTIRELNHKKAKFIPIVAMTANVFKEDIEKCLMAGMNDHIGKPVDFEEVLEKLRLYLT
jgi:CheY-like chemotaxis protein